MKRSLPYSISSARDGHFSHEPAVQRYSAAATVQSEEIVALLEQCTPDEWLLVALAEFVNQPLGYATMHVILNSVSAV